MKRSIIWSKWVNIMGRGDDKPQYIPEDEVTKPDNFSPDFDTAVEEEYEGEANPVVVTPGGMIPLSPFNDTTKVFNFWMGETNFPITQEIGFVLNSIPGVEVLDILTRYRFRIAVGNNFKFQDVRQEIERTFGAFNSKDPKNIPISNDLKFKIQKIIDIHLKDYKHWCVYIFPNEEIDFAATNAKSEFDDKYSLYKDCKDMIGGKLIMPGDTF